MLQDIRRSTRSGWTYILVGLLIVVFAVFFGVPGDACGSGVQRKLVAKVADTTIHTDDVNVVFNRVYGSQRRLDDSQLLQQQAQSLKAVVLINLLAEQARALGLRVTDDEFKEYLTDPLRNVEYASVYGRDGFDGPLYKAYVQNQLRVNISKYENFKRKELLARKYMDLLAMQYQPLPFELQELHELRNTEVNLEFVRFDREKLVEFVPVTDEQVDQFVQNNPDAIKKYYEENTSEFETPEEVLIRRIFIARPDEQAEGDAAEQARQKFEQAKQRVLQGQENFADVAGEISEDYAKEKQGLMDWSTVENLDQNIANALEGANVGDVKEVETPFAYMLVKLEDRREAKKTSLEEASRDIARRLVQQQRVDQQIERMVAQIRTAMNEHDTLQAAVDSLAPAAPAEGEETSPTAWSGVTVDETGFFSLEGQDLAAMFGGQFPGMAGRTPWDRIPKLGQSGELARQAFELTAEKPLADRTFQVDNAVVLPRLKERKDATDEALAESEPKLLAEIRGTKAASVLGRWQALFAVPLDEYGPYLENLYREAIEDGVVELYEKNYEAIPLVQPKSEDAPAEAPAPAGGTTGQTSEAS